ncbi:MAG: alkane 1-monooxygenase [Steroidobacteraceae bacterium]
MAEDRFAMLPYFMAYIVPLTAGVGLLFGGWTVWITLGVIYLVIPLADYWLGSDTRSREAGAELSTRDLVLLWAALPAQLALFAGLALVWHRPGVEVWERLGWIVSVGLSAGGLGITVAHELIHRRDRVSQLIGRALLLSVLYAHFAIEHLRGHHQRVGTDEDGASARFGQSVYAFIPTGIARQWVSAWRLEAKRLSKRGLRYWSLRNEMLVLTACQGLWLAGVAMIAGLSVMAAFIAAAAVAVVLLETVNYVEHYGLRRRVDESGRVEPVRATHSWNSDHRVSRVLLFELPRHTDHHMNAGRAYSMLQSVNHAPQLPAGYPTMVLVALVPPLWFRLMNPRVAAVCQQN